MRVRVTQPDCVEDRAERPPPKVCTASRSEFKRSEWHQIDTALCHADTLQQPCKALPKLRVRTKAKVPAPMNRTVGGPGGDATPPF